jgi:hypothetical protein
MIYYNETYVQDPNGPYAEEARQHLDLLRARVGLSTSVTSTNTAR